MQRLQNTLPKLKSVSKQVLTRTKAPKNHANRNDRLGSKN